MKRDFPAVREHAEEMISEGKIAGAAALVALKGETVFEEYYGMASASEGRKMGADAVFRLASMTKPVTAAAVLAARERGLVDLDAPVADHLPAYRDMTLRAPDGRETRCFAQITLRHLLSHTSGLGSYQPGMQIASELQPREGDTLAAVVDRYRRVPLPFVPGSFRGYSPIAAFDVAARVVEVAAKMPYAAFVKEALFDPIGMRDTTYSTADLRPGALAACSVVRDGVLDENTADSVRYGFVQWPDGYPGGGAGLMSTLRDYGKFAVTLARLGVAPNGRRVLGERSVELMRTPVMSEGEGCAWGLGVQVRVEEVGEQRLPVGSFGWSGAYGSHFFVSPEKELAAVYMHNSLSFGGGWAPHMVRFERDVAEALA